jgi:uncharacterized protein YdcH (DUF465 family)
MDREEQLKSLKRKLLDKQNKVDSMIFELREINESIRKMDNSIFENLNKSILSLADKIEEINKSSSLSNRIISEDLSLMVSDIRKDIKTQQKAIEGVLAMENNVISSVKSNPLSSDVSLRPKARINELVCYKKNLYLCVEDNTFRKVMLK